MMWTLPAVVATWSGLVSHSVATQGEWPLWESYAERFIQRDGRVIDNVASSRSTSEGQAYALFFALVANDRPRFDRVLKWTKDNLAKGDLLQQLPAWSWGRKPDGQWGVLDDNSASDADLWMAYALTEAGRLWKSKSLSFMGRMLLYRLTAEEVRDLPELGPMLLPGRRGFELRHGSRWKLNPSYMPVPLLRWAARQLPNGPWHGVLLNTARLMSAAPAGVQPDWILYDKTAGLFPEPHAPHGSYDAIRTYLWAGLTPTDDPMHKTMMRATRGLSAQWYRDPTLLEQLMWDGQGGKGQPAPPGYYAALLAWAEAASDNTLASAVRAKLQSTLRDGLYGTPPAYFDQNLTLFALGYLSSRFRFSSEGRLEPWWKRRWESAP